MGLIECHLRRNLLILEDKLSLRIEGHVDNFEIMISLARPTWDFDSILELKR